MNRFLFTGAEVICAETVMNPVQLYNADQIPEMDDELKFLFTIRLVMFDDQRWAVFEILVGLFQIRI